MNNRNYAMDKAALQSQMKFAYDVSGALSQIKGKSIPLKSSRTSTNRNTGMLIDGIRFMDPD